MDKYFSDNEIETLLELIDNELLYLAEAMHGTDYKPLIDCYSKQYDDACILQAKLKNYK